MTNRHWLFIAISIFMLVGLACNLSQSAGTDPIQAPATGEETTVAQSSADEPNNPIPTEIPTQTPVPTPTPIPSNPVGLRQGLSSLNSYRLTIRTTINGPTAYDKNQATTITESGSDGDSMHIHYEIMSSSEDEPEGSTSISDQYRVGNRTCDISEGDEPEISDSDPMAQEMLNTWYTMIDLVPMVNDPVFVGEEELNGVITNHFTFSVEGLGVDSGAEVVASSGEYWLAQDGQYVVKYSVILETRDGPADDPNTQTMYTEFYIEVQAINQDIVITMPGECQ